MRDPDDRFHFLAVTRIYNGLGAPRLRDGPDEPELADPSAQAARGHAKVVAISAEVQALRQLVQQLMAAIPNATTVGATGS